MKTFLIQLIDSRWLINGRPYCQMNEDEKKFFDEFLIAMRIISDAKKPKA